jgi:hypothetical protein
MRSGRTQIAQAWVLSLSLVVLQSGHASEDSKPIVDVRFDAPYQQVESSMGDEWAPTWGRDDVLYTGNNDGMSFGGMPVNTMAFGQLDGNDPYNLKGTTINGMQDYKEQELGPEVAAWNSLGSYKVDSVFYRFSPCGDDAGRSTCLVSSADGKTWTRGSLVLRGAKFTDVRFIVWSKQFETDLGVKSAEYAYATAYAGVIDGEDQYFVARAPIAKLPQIDVADWSFHQSDYSWGPLEGAAPMSSNGKLGPDGANWKTMNTYSVDGVLYMFVTRCTYPSQSTDAKKRHVWRNSSIIESTNNGRTWIRSAGDNFKKPMFPGMRFATPYFVWYGKDGAARVDNADKYVYAVSNNGYFENGDDYVLGRVLREKLPKLAAADWSFYKAGDGMQEASWTTKLNKARPVLARPGKSSMTGMTYIEDLHRYVMAVWHYHKDNFEQGIKENDLGTVVEFFEAGKPWGPWKMIKAFDTGKLGWFTPIIGQRFQSTVDANTVKAIFYATGFFTKSEGGVDASLYKLNYMPVTLSTKPLQHEDLTFVGAR